MSPQFRLLLLFLVTLCAGVGIGYVASHQPATAEARSPTVAPARPNNPPRPQWTKQELVAAATKFSAKVMSGSFNPYAELLAGWTDEEIRAALEESLRTPECVMENGGQTGLPGMLLRTWMDRDLDAAAAWFESLKSSSKGELFMALSHHWPEARAAEGLEFFLRLNQNLSSVSGWSIITKALRQQAANGPQAMGALLGRLLDQNVGLQFGNPLDLPKGFDFAALAKHEAFARLPDCGLTQSLLTEWSHQDPDGNFDWIAREGKWKQVGGLLNDPTGSKPEILAWLAGRIARLDASARESLFEGADFKQVKPAKLVTFANALQNPELAERVKCEGIRSIFAGNVKRVLPLLEAVSEPSRRLEILATMEPPPVSGRSVRFDDASVRILNNKLREWGADEAKAAAIIEHLRTSAGAPTP